MRIVLFHEIGDRACARVRKALHAEILKSRGHTVSFSNVAYAENLAALGSVADESARVPVLVLSADDSEGGTASEVTVLTDLDEIISKLEQLTK